MSGAYVSGKTIDNVLGYVHPQIEGLYIFAAHDGSGDTKMVGASITTFDASEATMKSDHHRVAQGLINLGDAAAVVAAYDSGGKGWEGQQHTISNVTWKVESGSGAAGVLALSDLRQLYVNPDGWAGVALEGEHTNTDAGRRSWRYVEGLLLLADDRQLYVNPDGCAGVAMEGDHTNTDAERRTWSCEQGILSIITLTSTTLP